MSLFCLLPIFGISRFTFALWPIWSFLTIPLLVCINNNFFPLTMFYYLFCLLPKIEIVITNVILLCCAVYTIHGMHGGNPLSHFWDSWPASEWWIPYRLSFFTVWLRNSTDLDKKFLTYTNGWLVALLCGLKFCLKLAWCAFLNWY